MDGSTRDESQEAVRKRGKDRQEGKECHPLFSTASVETDDDVVTAQDNTMQ